MRFTAINENNKVKGFLIKLVVITANKDAVNNFVNAIYGKKKYIFTDEEKYQNVAILDAIKKYC